MPVFLESRITININRKGKERSYYGLSLAQIIEFLQSFVVLVILGSPTAKVLRIRLPYKIKYINIKHIWS